MTNYLKVERGISIEKASKALILLHGRGGTASDILQFTQHLHVNDFYMAALEAPGNAWYPNSFMAKEELNEPALTLSVRAVKELIEQTANHIAKEKIYLLGFSQGACLALETSCRFADKFGGVIAFTGALIGSSIDPTKYHGHFQGTKVFIGTSDHDPHVPLFRAEETKTFMEQRGAHVTLKVYPGVSHTIRSDEIAFVNQYML